MIRLFVFTILSWDISWLLDMFIGIKITIFYSLITFFSLYLSSFVIKLLWLIYWGKWSITDITIISTYARVNFYIISLIVLIITKNDIIHYLPIQNFFHDSMQIFKLLNIDTYSQYIFFLIPYCWYISIFSKSLAKVQQISQTNATINIVVMSILIYYFNVWCNYLYLHYYIFR